MQCGVRARELGGVSSTAVLGVLVRGVQLGVGVLLSVWDTPLYSRYVEKRERACRRTLHCLVRSPQRALALPAAWLQPRPRSPLIVASFAAIYSIFVAAIIALQSWKHKWAKRLAELLEQMF